MKCEQLLFTSTGSTMKTNKHKTKFKKNKKDITEQRIRTK